MPALSQPSHCATPQVFPARPVSVAAITLAKWLELPLIAGFIVWLATDKAGSKPSLSSTSAHLGIATAVALFAVLAILGIPAGRSRVIVTPSGLVVVNPFRRFDVSLSQLRRVFWARYRLAPGSILGYPVVAFSIQTKPDGRLKSVRALSSLAGPRQGGLVECLEQLCSAHNIPCDLTTGS